MAETDGNQVPRPARARAPRTAVELVRRFGVFGLALACAAFTVVVYYPGYMSPDSVVMLAHARRGVDSNVYSPLLSYIWRVADRVLPGPGGMLIFHNLVFWLALAAAASALTRSVLFGACFVLLAGFWPPTFGMLGTIWKDVGMQAFLLAGVAFILRVRRTHRWGPLGMALVSLFLAVGYRHNAVAAALPLLVLILLEAAEMLAARQARLLEWLRVRGLIRPFWAAAALAALAVAVGGPNWVNNYGTVDAKLWAGALIHDLAGISVRQHTYYLPPYIASPPEITLADLERMYSPLHANSLGDPASRRFLEMKNPSPDKSIGFRLLTQAEAADLKLHWLATVLDNPGAYLSHRFLIAERMLGWRPRQPWYPYLSGIDDNPFGITFQPSALNTWVMKHIRAAAFTTRLYSAWIYYLVILGCVALSFLWDFAHARVIRALAASGVLYFLSVFFFGMSGDFRYNIWGLTCCYLCLMLVFCGGSRARAASGGSGTGE